MTTSEVYWLTRLDGIHDALIVGFAGGFMLLVIVSIFGFMHADLHTTTQAEEKLEKARVWRAIRLISIVAVLSGIASLLAPTTKELIAIYGLSYLTQNKDAREIPAQALKVLNEKLQEMQKD
jgi:hypothetical protein